MPLQPAEPRCDGIARNQEIPYLHRREPLTERDSVYFEETVEAGDESHNVKG
jgi:hypothetical protein